MSTEPEVNERFRREDMSPNGMLHIIQHHDGDITVSVFEGSPDGEAFRNSATVEFCEPSFGGGESPETWACLVDLMESMQADNDRRSAKHAAAKHRALLEGLSLDDAEVLYSGLLDVKTYATQTDHSGWWTLGTELHKAAMLLLEAAELLRTDSEKSKDAKRMITESIWHSFRALVAFKK